MTTADDKKCPKCGTVMCEKSDEREVGGVTLATPNGQFSCMRCGYDPGEGMSTVTGKS